MNKKNSRNRSYGKKKSPRKSPRKSSRKAKTSYVTAPIDQSQSGVPPMYQSQSGVPSLYQSQPIVSPTYPSQQIQEEPSFFQKYKYIIFSIVGLLVIGLIVFLIVYFLNKPAPPPQQDIVFGSLNDTSSFSANVPINTQFIPTFQTNNNSAIKSITLYPQGSSDISGKYFGLNGVAAIINFSFSITISNNVDFNKLKVSLNGLVFQGYCSISVQNVNGGGTKQVSNANLNNSITLTGTSIAAPLIINGNSPAGYKTAPTLIPSIDLVSYLAPGENDILITYGVVGSGNIAFSAKASSS